MAKLLRSNGATINVVPKNGRDFSYEELKRFVNGYIEIVRLGGNKIMVVNEEGKLIGLEVNQKATELYFKSTHVYDLIVGDVLVCDSCEVK